MSLTPDLLIFIDATSKAGFRVVYTCASSTIVFNAKIAIPIIAMVIRTLTGQKWNENQRCCAVARDDFCDRQLEKDRLAPSAGDSPEVRAPQRSSREIGEK